MSGVSLTPLTFLRFARAKMFHFGTARLELLGCRVRAIWWVNGLKSPLCDLPKFFLDNGTPLAIG